MTLQSLLQDLEPLRALHPLTPCNVEAVDFNGHQINIEQGDTGLECELSDAKEEIEAFDKDLEASEAENAELYRQLEKADADLEADAGASELKHAKESAETFRQAASAWSIEVKEAREELTALRKKKGVIPGYISQQNKILTLLGRLVEYPNEKGLKESAKEILHNIYRG